MMAVENEAVCVRLDRKALLEFFLPLIAATRAAKRPRPAELVGMSANAGQHGDNGLDLRCRLDRHIFALGLSLKLFRPGACRAVFCLGLVEPEADALAVGDQPNAAVDDALEFAVPDRAPSRLTAGTRHFGPLGNAISEACSLGFPVGLSRAATGATAFGQHRGRHFRTAPSVNDRAEEGLPVAPERKG